MRPAYGKSECSRIENLAGNSAEYVRFCWLFRLLTKCLKTKHRLQCPLHGMEEVISSP